jgi:hypothetical protein
LLKWIVKLVLEALNTAVPPVVLVPKLEVASLADKFAVYPALLTFLHGPSWLVGSEACPYPATESSSRESVYSGIKSGFKSRVPTNILRREVRVNLFIILNFSFSY